MQSDKIVLFAKQSGLTSFSSLFTIKHALNTQKVGHTGTLDSFAQGLLVVCTGSLTRLAGKITEFNKSYEAVIKFGEETDTLECTGQLVKKTPLPLLKDLEEVLQKYKGPLLQTPPSFSALHIDGKRASDLARSGKSVELSARKITVFDSELKEILLNEENRVVAARIYFSVSKGTYIRSLARDIACDCKSSGTLYGLFRKSVGDFKIEDAAGFSLLSKFGIKSALENGQKLKESEEKIKNFENYFQTNGIPKKDWKNNADYQKIKNSYKSYDEKILEQEVLQKSVNFNSKIAQSCGFGILTIKDDSKKIFRNGGKLHSSMFFSSPFEISEDFAAVFSEQNDFLGLLQKNEQGYFEYSFVVSY